MQSLIIMIVVVEKRNKEKRVALLNINGKVSMKLIVEFSEFKVLNFFELFSFRCTQTMLL